MTNKQIEDLTGEEFQEVLDGMLDEEFEKVTVPEFFGALAAMDEVEPEVIELTAHVEGGELVLDQSTAVPVSRNEIHLPGKRIVIKLREKAPHPDSARTQP